MSLDARVGYVRPDVANAVKGHESIWHPTWANREQDAAILSCVMGCHCGDAVPSMNIREQEWLRRDTQYYFATQSFGSLVEIFLECDGVPAPLR